MWGVSCVGVGWRESAHELDGVEFAETCEELLVNFPEIQKGQYFASHAEVPCVYSVQNTRVAPRVGTVAQGERAFLFLVPLHGWPLYLNVSPLEVTRTT